MEEEIVKKRIMVIMIWKFGDLEIWRWKFGDVKQPLIFVGDNTNKGAEASESPNFQISKSPNLQISKSSLVSQPQFKITRTLGTDNGFIACRRF
jgi:hypothetical protein